MSENASNSESTLDAMEGVDVVDDTPNDASVVLSNADDVDTADVLGAADDAPDDADVADASDAADVPGAADATDAAGVPSATDAADTDAADTVDASDAAEASGAVDAVDDASDVVKAADDASDAADVVDATDAMDVPDVADATDVAETPRSTATPSIPKASSTPSIEVLEAELGRERHKHNYLRALRSTVFSLLIVAAAAVLVAMLALPILQITGASMTETLQDRDVVVALRGSNFKTGDLIAFYYNNNILVKRVIATEGQWVNITDDGTVYVDDVALDEPYVSDKSKGGCNIQLPYQVPEGKIFVMGDHRSTSVDSRSTALGCVSNDMLLGHILFRIWPLNALGPVK